MGGDMDSNGQFQGTVTSAMMGGLGLWGCREGFQATTQGRGWTGGLFYSSEGGRGQTGTEEWDMWEGRRLLQPGSKAGAPVLGRGPGERGA